MDPNRNFPTNFFGPGASDKVRFYSGSNDDILFVFAKIQHLAFFQPCDDSYHGTEPFSEAETQAIRQVDLSHSGQDATAGYKDVVYLC